MLKTHQIANTHDDDDDGRTRPSEMTKLSRGVNQYRGNSNIRAPARGVETYDEDEEFYVIGDRVLVDQYRPGSVAYFGETEFGAGDWVGVVLDEPTGNHAGKLHGREYFQCAQNHGLFVRAHRVSPLGSKSRGGEMLRGSPRTPTPTYNQLLGGGGGVGNRWWAATPMTPQPPSRGSSSKSPASPLDSYYYDDDYRQDSRGPTIASLALKLKSIDERQHSPVGSGTPAGILKHHNRWQPAINGVDEARSRRGSQRSDSHSSGLGSSQRDLSTSMSSRLDDLDRRLRASSVSPGAARRRSMFSFRPKREPLGSDQQQVVAAPHTASKHRSLDDSRQNVNDATTARVNFSSELAKLGDRVRVRTGRDEGELEGVLRFMGETEFATGEWAGVELDERAGKNDGAILGHRYFHCAQGRGLFVPASRVRKCTLDTSAGSPETNSFDSMRSTIFSPPPPLGRHYDSSSATPTSGLASAFSSSSSSSSATSSPYGVDRLSAGVDPDRWHRPPVTELPPPPPPPVRTYVSRATSISPLDGREPAAILERHYNRRAKFDDRDLERELARSSDKPATYGRRPPPGPRAKAVTYTFVSNKLDGNPIAKRTLVYE